MGRQCFYTGKKTQFGIKKTTRGKAKYLGGVGTKITGLTRRKVKPNLQTVRAMVDGKVVRLTVSTSAIRSGLVVKPVVHQPFTLDREKPKPTPKSGKPEPTPKSAKPSDKKAADAKTTAKAAPAKTAETKTASKPTKKA